MAFFLNYRRRLREHNLSVLAFELEAGRRKFEHNLQIKATAAKILLQRQTAEIETAKQKAEYDLRIREENEKVSIERRMAAIEIAKNAAANGTPLQLVFALLTESAPALQIHAREIESTRLSIYKEMQPPQIAASRASVESIGDGLALSMRPVELEAKNAALAAQVLSLEKNNATLWNQIDRREDMTIKTMQSQIQAIGASKQPLSVQKHCSKCGVVRPFKNGKCTFCGQGTQATTVEVTTASPAQ